MQSKYLLMRRIGLVLFICSQLLVLRAADVIEADICVYGGTAGGVASAVQAARMGKTAVVAEFGNHIGGMTSAGLGSTDIGNKAAIGGIAREFYHRVAQHYARDDAWTIESRDDFLKTKSSRTPPDLSSPEATMWTFEPHVAEDIFFQMLNESMIPVFLHQRLAQVKKEGARIVEITMESGKIFRA